MTKVELSLIMELYKQINELQHENMLLDNKVWQLEDDNLQLTNDNEQLKDDNVLLNNRVWGLKDDIYELETENRLLKTELLNSLRRTLDS